MPRFCSGLFAIAFALFFLGSGSALYAQKAKLPARIILKSGDTLNTTSVVLLNLFYRKIIDERSITQYGVTTYDSVTEKSSEIDKARIQEVRLTDPKGAVRLFVNVDGNLEELMCDGKIKWMRYFTTHGYDRGILVNDYLLNENGEKVKLGAFFNNKKRLKEVTASMPELVPEINKMKMSYENLRVIIQKYNEG